MRCGVYRDDDNDDDDDDDDDDEEEGELGIGQGCQLDVWCMSVGGILRRQHRPLSDRGGGRRRGGGDGQAINSIPKPMQTW